LTDHVVVLIDIPAPLLGREGLRAQAR